MAFQHNLCVEEGQAQKLHGIYIMQLMITLTVARIAIQEILKSILDQNIKLQFQPLNCGLPIPAVSGIPRILFGGVSTNSVEDRGQREQGSVGSSPLVRGSGGSCNLVQEILFHIVKFSSFLVL